MSGKYSKAFLCSSGPSPDSPTRGPVCPGFHCSPAEIRERSRRPLLPPSHVPLRHSGPASPSLARCASDFSVLCSHSHFCKRTRTLFPRAPDVPARLFPLLAFLPVRAISSLLFSCRIPPLFFNSYPFPLQFLTLRVLYSFLSSSAPFFNSADLLHSGTPFRHFSN